MGLGLGAGGGSREGASHREQSTSGVGAGAGVGAGVGAVPVQLVHKVVVFDVTALAVVAVLHGHDRRYCDVPLSTVV